MTVRGLGSFDPEISQGLGQTVRSSIQRNAEVPTSPAMRQQNGDPRCSAPTKHLVPATFGSTSEPPTSTPAPAPAPVTSSRSAGQHPAVSPISSIISVVFPCEMPAEPSTTPGRRAPTTTRCRSSLPRSSNSAGTLNRTGTSVSEGLGACCHDHHRAKGCPTMWA